MKDLQLFLDLVRSSSQQIWLERHFFWKSYLALVILDNLEIFNVIFKTKEESGAQLFVMFFSMLAVLMVLARIVLREKNKRGKKEELLYFLITYLLYNLYYSFLFFLGLLVFVLPGLYVLLSFYLVPLVAVLEDDSIEGGHCFRRARLLAKKNLSLVAFVAVASLLTDALSLIGSSFSDPMVKLTFNFFFSFIESYLAIVMTLSSVKLYYYLVSLAPGASKNAQSAAV